MLYALANKELLLCHCIFFPYSFYWLLRHTWRLGKFSYAAVLPYNNRKCKKGKFLFIKRAFGLNYKWCSSLICMAHMNQRRLIKGSHYQKLHAVVVLQQSHELAVPADLVLDFPHQRAQGWIR